jgi:hypothetical protein
MQKPSPQAPELKALLAYLEAKLPLKKSLRLRAAVLTDDIIANAQRQSRRKK